MGLRGQQPKPTALRLLEGNPSQHALPENEPKPRTIEDADPPEWLSTEAKTYWRRLLPMLGAAGLVTEVDLLVLERYCDCLADWRSARDFLVERGSMFYPIYDGPPDPATGVRPIKYLQEYPHVAKKLKMSEHLLRIEQHFGMTPAARTRIILGGADPEAPEDPFAFKRGSKRA